MSLKQTDFLLLMLLCEDEPTREENGITLEDCFGDIDLSSKRFIRKLCSTYEMEVFGIYSLQVYITSIPFALLDDFYFTPSSRPEARRVRFTGALPRPLLMRTLPGNT